MSIITIAISIISFVLCGKWAENAKEKRIDSPLLKNSILIFILILINIWSIGTCISFKYTPNQFSVVTVKPYIINANGNIKLKGLVIGETTVIDLNRYELENIIPPQYIDPITHTPDYTKFNVQVTTILNQWHWGNYFFFNNNYTYSIIPVTTKLE